MDSFYYIIFLHGRLGSARILALIKGRKSIVFGEAVAVFTFGPVLLSLLLGAFCRHTLSVLDPAFSATRVSNHQQFQNAGLNQRVVGSSSHNGSDRSYNFSWAMLQPLYLRIILSLVRRLNLTLLNGNYNLGMVPLSIEKQSFKIRSPSLLLSISVLFLFILTGDRNVSILRPVTTGQRWIGAGAVYTAVFTELKRLRHVFLYVVQTHLDMSSNVAPIRDIHIWHSKTARVPQYPGAVPGVFDHRAVCVIGRSCRWS